MTFGALRPPLAHVAPSIAAAIMKSVERDALESLDEIMEAIEDGRMIAWAATSGSTLDGVTVTEILEGGKGRQCFIRHCARADGGAPLAEWLDQLSVIETWALSEGCASVELLGRAGWERALPGYQKQAVQLRKMLKAA